METNTLSKKGSPGVLQTLSKETVEDFLFSQCKDEISEEQKALFIGIAMANNLNPFKREIYPIPFWNSKLGKNDMQPVTAYTVYLQKAQASGKLDGWETEIHEKDGKVTGGKITIHRKDRDHPFTWEVDREEIVQTKKDGMPNKNRTSKPRFMTKKTLIGQGMRLCFPEDIGGMPYLEEEAPEVIDGNIVENEEKPQKIKANLAGLQVKSVKKEIQKTESEEETPKSKTEEEPDLCSIEQQNKIVKIYKFMKYANEETKKKLLLREFCNKSSIEELTSQEAEEFFGKLKQGLKKRIITDRIYDFNSLSSKIDTISSFYDENSKDEKQILDDILAFGEELANEQDTKNTETKKEEATAK